MKNFFLQKLSGKTEKSKSGQVAIILIFIIAVGLIFFAATLNLGKVSQHKTVTQIAANTSASLMMSTMASYGQQLFKTQLGGEVGPPMSGSGAWIPIKCDSTGVWNALIAVVLIIVAVVIAIVTYGAGSIPAATVIGLALGLLMAVTALTLQVTVVQPGLTDAWNRMMGETMGMEDSGIESAISNGLQRAVTDNVKVPDYFDQDEDMIFGDTGNPAGVLLIDDWISRYGAYYTDRLLSVQPLDYDAPFQFLRELKEIIYENPFNVSTPDNFGLFDSMTCPDMDLDNNTIPPSVCNPCCIPQGLRNNTCVDWRDTDGDNVPDHDHTELEIYNACLQKGIFDPAAPNKYPWVFDPAEQNSNNSFESLLEFFGRDDEHSGFFKNPIKPNTIFQVVDPLAKFNVKDTTGFYSPPIAGSFINPTDDILFRNCLSSCSNANCSPGVLPVGGPYGPYPSGTFNDTVDCVDPVWGWRPGNVWYDAVLHNLQIAAPDTKKGVHEFFHKTADYGLNLMDVNVSNTAANPYYCQWFDPADSLYTTYCPSAVLPYGETNLHLFELPSTLLYERSWQVDSINSNIIGDPPLASDKFGFPAANNIVAADDYCANQELLNIAANKGFWKKGADMYCSTTWPYLLNCPQGNEEDCVSFTPNATNFHWDVIDDIVYRNIPDVIGTARPLFRFSPQSVMTWYVPHAAPLIEPGSLPPNQGGSSAVDGVDCVAACPAQDGLLVKLEKRIKLINTRIKDWLQTSYASNSCDETWCLPDPNVVSCVGVPPEEQATFDVNGNSIPGDLEDIVQCLNYNIEGVDPVGNIYPVGTNHGNDLRLTQCGVTCWAGDCSNLPRSVIPMSLYDPQAYTAGNLTDEVDIAQMLQCVDSCSAANCTLVSAGGTLPDNQTSSGVPYNYPPFVPADCGTPNWAPSATPSFYNSLIENLARAGSSCNLNDVGGSNPNLSFPGWLYETRQAGREARNQIAKFKKRRDYLNDLLTRMKDMSIKLTQAEDKIHKFLTCDLNGDGIIQTYPVGDPTPDWGPACALMNFVRGYEKRELLPFEAIYGWQSEEPVEVTPGASRGLWHLVRVQARMPGRCNGSSCGDGWPTIKTDTDGLLDTTRCYWMENLTGTVKFRVTRYDEAKSPGVLFNNKQKLWQFDFSNRQNQTNAIFSANEIAQSCQNLMLRHPTGAVPPWEGPFKGAFMINQYVFTQAAPPYSPVSPPATPPEITFCRLAALKYLAMGVESESCGQFFWQSGSPQSFKVQFVPCPNDW